MGYEIAGGLGVKLAAPEREVYVLVGDGSYLMLPAELATAIQDGLKLTIVLVDNHGFNSIGGLSRSLGTRRLRHAVPYRRRLARGSTASDPAAPAPRPRGERRVARRARHPRRPRSTSCAPRSGREAREADDGDRGRGRPLRGRARLRELVGRPRGRGLGAGVGPRSRARPTRRRAPRRAEPHVIEAAGSRPRRDRTSSATSSRPADALDVIRVRTLTEYGRSSSPTASGRTCCDPGSCSLDHRDASPRPLRRWASRISMPRSSQLDHRLCDG